jgi:integrase
MTSTIIPASPQQSQRQGKALNAFISGLKSTDSQKQYPYQVKPFFDFILPNNNDNNGFVTSSSSLEEKADIFVNKAKDDPQWAQENIVNFIDYCKRRVNVDKTLTAGTLQNYFHIIKLFCEMNNLDTIVNWKKISRGLPKARLRANDRSPLAEEIRELVKHSDRRLKSIVYTMCSSGIRVGAFEFLKWKHVIPKIDEKTGQVLAAKLIVYADEPEQHYGFITPECDCVLQDYMNFRASYGEQVTGESWLIRDLWQTSDIPRNHGGDGANRRGLASYPKRLSVQAIQRELLRAEREQGLRPNLPKGVRRHDWKTTHGFRKFFQSAATAAGMKPIHIEYLMGHSLGITGHYFRPQEDEVFRDYLKAIDGLLIDKDQKTATLLQKQVAELAEKNEEANQVISTKLAQKEKEAEEMRKQIAELTKTQQVIVKNLDDMAKTEKWFMDDPIVTFENTLRRMLGKRDKNGNYNHNLPQIEAAIKRIKEGDKLIEKKLYSPDGNSIIVAKKKNKKKKKNK